MFKRHVTWVGVVAVLLLLAGCTITVVTQGRLIISVDHIPTHVKRVKYDLELKQGVGIHRKIADRIVTRSPMVFEFGEVNAGRWSFKVIGLDASDKVVFEKERDLFVEAGELTIDVIDAGGKRPPRR